MPWIGMWWRICGRWVALCRVVDGREEVVIGWALACGVIFLLLIFNALFTVFDICFVLLWPFCGGDDDLGSPPEDRSHKS